MANWKGDFVKSLSEEAIDVHIALAAETPSPFCLMQLYRTWCRVCWSSCSGRQR